MTSPQQQLDQLIDDLHNNKPTSPQNAEETLTADLIQLAQQFDLSPDFDNVLMGQVNAPSLNHPPRRIKRLRWVATFVIGLLGVTLLFATVPTLRVLAEDIIAELFPRDTETSRVIKAESDRLAFEEDDFIAVKTLDELQTLVDFDIKPPDLDSIDFDIGSPAAGPGYQFEHGSLTIPRNSISMAYTLPMSDSNRFLNLRIRQQPLEDSKRGVFFFTSDQDTISPEAETTPVSINGYRGEIVQGDWFTSNSGSDKKYFFWKSDAPTYRLRWQDAEFLYEIELWTQSDSSIDELIAIAESMMD